MRHAVGFEEFVDDARPERVTRTSVRHGDEGKETAKASLKDCARRGGEKRTRMDKPSTIDRNDAHLGEIAKSSFSGSGSDQTRSAMGPSWGISRGGTERIS